MDKEKKWEKIIEMDEFSIETDGKILRAVDDEKNVVVVKTKKLNDI